MENYWEGWGFSDRIPVTISATPRKIEILKLELAKSFPDNQVDELDSRNIRFYAREEQLKKLKKFVSTLNGKVYYEKGGEIGEALASSNPYIGGAKVIQGIAPESVSALDKKMARKINPDPNRPIFFKGGGQTPKEKNLINYKKAIEVYIKERYNEDVNWFESMVLFSDKTDETRIKKAVIVTKNGNEYEVYHEDLFDKYDNGGGVDIIAPFGTLVSKNKQQKLEYKKVGSNVEFIIYEGVNNPVSNYSRTSFKKSKNGSRIMNYKEFLKFIHSNGFVADQKYALGGGVDDLEINKILKKLENHYLFGGRGLDLITDLEQVQNPQNTTYYETIARKDFFETQLYEWLKKYDIIGGFTIIWVGDLEIINNWKSKINELKSNGYLVVKKISAPTKNRTKHFRYIAIKQKFDNGGSVGQTDYSVAQTILNQLGGMKRLVVMTGAYNFVASTNAVSFRIKNRKVNYIKITLNGKDLYDVKFSRIFNYQEKVVAELNDIYFDQLIPIFEQNTGMYLKMFKKGGMVSTQNRDMVISQLKAIHHHQKEMLDTLKNSGEVEAWVLAKVSNASSDLSDIAHYLEFKE